MKIVKMKRAVSKVLCLYIVFSMVLGVAAPAMATQEYVAGGGASTDDGWIILPTYLNDANVSFKIQTSSGTYREVSIGHASHDFRADEYTAYLPVSKGDKVTLVVKDNSGNENPGISLGSVYNSDVKTVFVPAGGGTSVEDLKEELKKGTFEEIKTKTLRYYNA